jgi:hypothetical protein
VLKSSAKGLYLESLLSELFHSEFTPILISSRFLRKRGGGQVDIAYFHGDIIYLIEVKSFVEWSMKQRQRLNISAQLISSFFQKSSLIYQLKKQ